MGIFGNRSKTIEVSYKELPLFLQSALAQELNQHVNSSAEALQRDGYTLVETFAFEYFSMIMTNYINACGTLKGKIKEEDFGLMLQGFISISLRSFVKCFGNSNISDEQFSLYWKELHKRMRVWHEFRVADTDVSSSDNYVVMYKFLASRFIKDSISFRNVDAFTDILEHKAISLQTLLEAIAKFTVVY